LRDEIERRVAEERHYHARRRRALAEPQQPIAAENGRVQGGNAPTGDGANEPGREDAPPLPARATSEQWDAWLGWYYRQLWGVVTDRAGHIAVLTGKSISTVEKRHADYMTNRRSLQLPAT
jgi:hypothetical protein